MLANAGSEETKKTRERGMQDIFIRPYSEVFLCKPQSETMIKD